MARVTKKPAERRSELIDAAERLFLEKGYERTAVSDIVKSIPVAQGTFYYYFNSKNSILEAVLGRNFSAMESRLLSIIGQGDIDPCTRFNEMLNSLFRFTKEKKGLIDAAHLTGNAVMHHKLEEMSHTKLIPLLQEIVKEGVTQGQFNTPYPEETIDLIFHAVMHVIQEPGFMSDRSRRKRLRVVLEHFLVSVLGITNHTIALKL